MNYKYWLKPKLERLEDRRAALQNIPDQIRALECAFGGIRAAKTDGDPVSGGTNHREDALIDNITEREKLQQDLEATRLEVETMDKAIAKLEEKERRVLDLAYIHKQRGYIERLAEEFGCDTSTIYRLRRQAEVRLCIILCGGAGL